MLVGRRLEKTVRRLAKKKSFAERLINESRRSRRMQREVSLSQLQRNAEDRDVVFVPGKVLGNGVLTKKLTVGAFSFSRTAISKITATGGRPLLLEDFLKEFGDARGVKLIG
ncbi:MAG: 50S ribosomal protein L18e [Candidatus Caldarchaeum sp.]|nr:50S ribosomal protein L18e [Candidatus Caldarchaeum sp.]